MNVRFEKCCSMLTMDSKDAEATSLAKIPQLSLKLKISIQEEIKLVGYHHLKLDSEDLSLGEETSLVKMPQLPLKVKIS